ncbi:hypothetical protein [Agrococcus citreus]|uniref:Transcriptional regulator, AbiEi antitoxin, Type IV TA system n=1 Tax=Agrococcus citreus TaxID=84643 RepID=A0ABN1YS61_9MICO
MRDSDRAIWDSRARLQRTRDLRADAPTRVPSQDERLTRIRQGVYARAEDLDGAPHGVQYLARIEATAQARRAPIFARESALAVHGVPYGREPERVFTIGGASTAGLKAGVQHARVTIAADDVVQERGLLVCSLPYALADTARHRDQRVAVAAIDAALHEQLVSKEAILDALSRQSRVGQARARASIAFAEGAAESVGESWSRVVLQLLGFPAPELQPAVRGASGRWWHPDFRWRLADLPRPLLGEFDGMTKYGDLAAREGLTPQQALAREKRREDDLRAENDTVHWVWGDVTTPRRLERILLARGVPRIRPSSLWLPGNR